MKSKTLKIMLPVLTIGTIATPVVAIASCSCYKEKAFPSNWLEIDEKGLLQGFDKEHQSLDKVKNYNKLLIPKQVKAIEQTAFVVGSKGINDAPVAIESIEFENESNFEGGFSFAYFIGCEKLSKIDIRNTKAIIDPLQLHDDPIIAKKGKIIIKKDNEKQYLWAETSVGIINDRWDYNWEIVEK